MIPPERCEHGALMWVLAPRVLLAVAVVALRSLPLLGPQQALVSTRCESLHATATCMHAKRNKSDENLLPRRVPGVHSACSTLVHFRLPFSWLACPPAALLHWPASHLAAPSVSPGLQSICSTRNVDGSMQYGWASRSLALPLSPPRSSRSSRRRGHSSRGRSSRGHSRRGRSRCGRSRRGSSRRGRSSRGRSSLGSSSSLLPLQYSSHLSSLLPHRPCLSCSVSS